MAEVYECPDSWTKLFPWCKDQNLLVAPLPRRKEGTTCIIITLLKRHTHAAHIYTRIFKDRSNLGMKLVQQ